MKTPTKIADSFSEIDVHDDTVESFKIIPAVGRASCKVTLVLNRHWENKQRMLQFTGCANISFRADTTVLFNNAPNNTCGLEATASIDEIMKIMRSQKKEWNVTYQKSIDPLPPKLAAAKIYVLFRVRLFGGVLEVVAKSFKLTRLTRRSSSRATRAGRAKLRRAA
jgi:hypothetical protein